MGQKYNSREVALLLEASGSLPEGAPLMMAIGLATASMLIELLPGEMEDREATTYFNLQPGEKVAMVWTLYAAYALGGGVLVADSVRAVQIISKGGGTPALRPYLRFVNLIRKS
jgi:hypothetical protein